jgi:uncharacterized protein (DUF302 family)
MTTTTNYGLRHEVTLPYDDAVSRVREELGQEGFGVITEIDVRATFKTKLDIDFKPYVILGACNPSLAHGALTAEEEIGLLLPCNVIVYAMDDGTSRVVALDPVRQLSLSGNPELEPVANEVRSRLARALDRLAS